MKSYNFHVLVNPHVLERIIHELIQTFRLIFVPSARLIHNTTLSARLSRWNWGNGIIPGQMSVILRSGCQHTVCCRRQTVLHERERGLPRDDVKYRPGCISCALAGYKCANFPDSCDLLSSVGRCVIVVMTLKHFAPQLSDPGNDELRKAGVSTQWTRLGFCVIYLKQARLCCFMQD